VRLRVSDEAMARDSSFIAMLAKQKGSTSTTPNNRSSHAGNSRASHTGLERVAVAASATRAKRREPNAMQVSASAAELVARRKVYKLRRELAHSRSLSAMWTVMEQNRATGAEVRHETQRLRGAHLSNSVALVPPASDADVSRLATLLMQQLNKIEVEPSNRSWFKLFKMFDEDNDGHISYKELVTMIRKTIRMPDTIIPDRQIQAVWHSIDRDGNGWIDAGEFGRFFRQGEKPTKDAKDACQRLKQVAKAEFREPSLAEIAVELSQCNRQRLEQEAARLEDDLRRTTATLPPIALAQGSAKSLPPLR